MKAAPVVWAVVVAWQRAALADRCRVSLEATTGARLCRLLVIDDAADRAAGADGWDAVIPLDGNRGYAAACNAGARWALEQGATHLLFLNDDTRVEAGAVTALVTDAHCDCAILAPLILDREGRIWSAGGHLRRPLLVNGHVGAGNPAHMAPPEGRVAWATGCALFVSVSTYRRIGPFDERLFLYLEDVEWCLRAAALGIETRLVREAVIRHDVSASTRTLPAPARLYYECRNTYQVALRHNARLGRLQVLADLVHRGARAAAAAVLLPSRRRDPMHRARRRALADALRGRGGPFPTSMRGVPVAVGARR